MSSLTDLALAYEISITTIEMDRFAELMAIQRGVLREIEASKINKYRVLIRAASKRNDADLEGDLYDEELSGLLGELSQCGYAIPDGASTELTSAMMGKVSQRIQFYQDLLTVEGQFDDWRGLLRAKYHDGSTYMESLRPLMLAERKMIGVESEITAQLPEVVSQKKPLTQESLAQVYARRQIRNIIFEPLNIS